MNKASLCLLLIVWTGMSACNRESSRSRRATKPAVVDHTVKITDSSFDREVAESFQPALVEFWHDKSAECEEFAPVMEALAVEFEGRLKVGKVHVGEGPKLAEYYSIRGTMPVTILFNGTTEVERFVGPKSKDEIAARLNKLLPPKK